MKLVLFAPLLLIYSLQTACSHTVMDSYPEYLQKNENTLKLPKTKKSLSYTMNEKTSSHSEKIRSFKAGLANSWVIEFGKVLQATMQSKDLKKAFTKIEENGDSADVKWEVSLQKFTFKEHRAYIAIDVNATTKDGKRLFMKTYQAQGNTQGGKMFWGGAFAMRNAIHQSTKAAMDKIFTSLVNDLQKALKKKGSYKSS